MKKFSFILLVLLIASPVGADWVKIPAIGTGVPFTDPYRPDLSLIPDKIDKWSGLDAGHVKGVPQYFLVWIDADSSGMALPTEVVRTTKEDAAKELTARGAKVDEVEKNKDTDTGIDTIRSSIIKLLRKLASWVEIASAWAASASDNFNRSDNVDLGANWTAITGYSDLKIVSNQVYSGTVNVTNGERNTAVSPGANQFAQLTLKVWNNQRYAWVVLRQESGANTGYQMTALETTTAIYKMVAGDQTELASVAVTWTANDVLRGEITGTGLNLKKNGSSVLTGSNGDITAAGSVGVAMYTPVDATDVQIDDWSGGDLGGRRVRVTVVQ